MLIFIGPTASGKTTYMKALCSKIKKSGGKCVSITSPPFGGPAFLIIILLSRILIFSYRPKLFWRRWRGLSVLGTLNPELLSKLLPLLIMADFAFKVIQHLAFRVLEKLGLTVLVEDYFPQMISDHLAFLKLYRDYSKTSKHIITLELRLFYGYARKSENTMCLDIYADVPTRLMRELKRSGVYMNIAGFYDNVVRNFIPRELCRTMNVKTIFITNEGIDKALSDQ